MRDLNWYDHETKKMLRFCGGDLEFIYNSEHRRCLPKVVDRFEKTSTSNSSHIQAWINRNADKYNISIVEHFGKSLIIDVADEHVEDVEHDLYEEKILFDR